MRLRSRQCVPAVVRPNSIGTLTMKPLLDLAERVEAAPSDSADLIREAATLMLGSVPDRMSRMLAAEAYESAAMTLLPATDVTTAVFWRVGNDGEGGDPALFKAQVLIVTPFTSSQFIGLADTAPNAITAAALRAIAAKEG